MEVGGGGPYSRTLEFQSPHKDVAESLDNKIFYPYGLKYKRYISPSVLLDKMYKIYTNL